MLGAYLKSFDVYRDLAEVNSMETFLGLMLLLDVDCVQDQSLLRKHIEPYFVLTSEFNIREKKELLSESYT